MADMRLMSWEDRISALPVDTRRHILSFLTTRDAMLTSAVSKCWRYDWLGIPCLNFGREFFLKRWKIAVDDDDDCGLRNIYNQACRDGPDPKEAQRFLEFLDKAIVSKRPTIQKLHLYLPPISDLSGRIASCFNGFIVNQLEVDVIGDSKFSKLNRSYEVPKCVLSSNCMTRLYIEGCNLSSIKINEINLPSLCELSVNRVVMNQQVIENLVASCFAVEKLCFTDCEGFQSLKVLGHPKLQYLKQKHNRGLKLFEINAANLRSLYHHPDTYCTLVLAASCNALTHLMLSGCSSLNGLESLDLYTCQNISDLRLSKCWFSNEWLNKHLSQFACLEVLEIAFCNGSNHLNITSLHLQRLIIRCGQDLVHVQVNCPNLNDFSICTKGNIISLSSENTIAPSFVSLQFEDNGTGNSTWDVKLIELFNQLRKSKYLSIQTRIIENVIIPRPLRLKSQSPLCEFEELKLFPDYSVSYLDITRSIEALLWLCPRLNTLHIMDKRLGPSPQPYAHREKGLLKMLLKLKYKEQDELPQTGCGCYPSLPVNCWRHSLTGFEITEQQGFEDNDCSVRRFLEKSVMGV